MRTPIQPILSMVGIVRSRKGLINNEELDDSLGLICRNAERLKRLAEDILDVTRIESQSLTFTKERLNLNEVIFDTIQNNVWNQIDRDNKVKIIFEPKYEDSNIIYVKQKEIDYQRV